MTAFDNCKKKVNPPALPPLEPTKEMMRAGRAALPTIDRGELRDAWRAMHESGTKGAPKGSRAGVNISRNWVAMWITAIEGVSEERELTIQEGALLDMAYSWIDLDLSLRDARAIGSTAISSVVESFTDDIFRRLEQFEARLKRDISRDSEALNFLGEIAYSNYVEAVGGITWDGKKIPAWEDLDSRQREGWRAAGQSVYNAAK